MKKAIQVQNISKKYVIGHEGHKRYETFRDSLAHFFKSMVRNLLSPFTGGVLVKGELEDFWALRDISFEIDRGDKVAIIGSNGAGKSTLLKIISRITEPTTGQITLNGTVSALLEVGTGFHPELTGRENIYLNGSILGMKKSEIEENFDAIVQFAGVENFLDTPVKRYSSGMQVRLAFAVSAHLTPDIMIIDEVLAVGDAEFQKKCMGKMDEVSQSGRTVLFVSHNMSAVRSLCNKGILVDRGRIVKVGKIEDVISHYLKSYNKITPEILWAPSKAPQNSFVRLLGIRILDQNEVKTAFPLNSEDMHIEIEYESLSNNNKLGLTIALYSEEGLCVFGTISNNEAKWHGKLFPKGIYKSRCTIYGDLLKGMMYSVRIWIWKENFSDPLVVDNAIEFKVEDSGKLRKDYFGGMDGVIMPKLNWDTTKIGQ